MKEDDLVKKNSFCPSFLTGNLSCLLLRRFNYLHFIIKGKREVLAAGHLSLTFVKATWKKNLFSMRTRIIPARTFTESGSPRDLAIWFGIERKTKQKSTRTYFFLVSSASGQDEPNHVLNLADQGVRYMSCWPSVRARWLDITQGCFYVFMKQSNIYFQPSWPSKRGQLRIYYVAFLVGHYG